MPHHTLNDLDRYLRCPYEYHSDRLSDNWRITLDECLDLAVHDVATMVDGSILRTGRSMDLDRALTSFWEAWDRHVPDVYPEPFDPLGTIRFGEKCVTNLVIGNRKACGTLVASGISATVGLEDGHSIIIPIDTVHMTGRTATVNRYLCDAGVRSVDELARDRGMLLVAKWVLSNISGCNHVRMVWTFLGSNVRVEAVAEPAAMASAVSAVSNLVGKLDCSDDALPRDSDHCAECPYINRCPRKMHANTLISDPGSMDTDRGVKLVDDYAEIMERIEALKRRLDDLEARRESLSGELMDYAESNGFMALSGHGCSALIRHERKAELPDDKTEIVSVLRSAGLYDEYSMPNWSKIRGEISKGAMDRRVSQFATVHDQRRVYFKRNTGGYIK